MAESLDLGAMLAQVQQLQANMANAQLSLAEQRIDGTAGGGVVRATVTGQGELVALAINPSVVDPADVEMLEDLVVAAIADATRRARTAQQAALGPLATGLTGPGSAGAAGTLPGGIGSLFG